MEWSRWKTLRRSNLTCKGFFSMTTLWFDNFFWFEKLLMLALLRFALLKPETHASKTPTYKTPTYKKTISYPIWSFLRWSVKGFSAWPLLISFYSQTSRQTTEWSWKKGFSAWPLCDLTSFLICKFFDNVMLSLHNIHCN